ncbi:hypothetical protein [Haloferula sp. A504]|uniref:hypothetical protein n=1 Tax=Haloferula sp. A504 TaxID=3373601 RepID=UPI0031BDD773|nr:hypothetical protein [Verrucomicrobiaceae bacterium E54]
MITLGVLAGIFVDIPAIQAFGFGDKKEESQLEQVDPDSFREAISAEHRLTVIHMMMDGNPDSEKLQEILEQLQEEQTYGKKVAYAELDVEKHEDMAAAQGVDFEEFTGQMDFYAAGYKLGTLKGPADRPKVEATIERYLAGLVKRFGPGWLPDVDGLKRAGAGDRILNVQPADPVPGVQPAGGGEIVPGLQRAPGAKPPANPPEQP